MIGVLVGASVVAVAGMVSASVAQDGAFQAGHPDQARSQAIEARLGQDPMLRDDAIVAEVTGKRVRLVGVVDDAAERQHAERLVWQIDPTLIVENLLQSETDAEPQPAVAEDSEPQGSGQLARDSWISARIRAELMSDGFIGHDRVHVDTTQQVVTLRGQVGSEPERRRIIDIARYTRDVLVVIDEMALVPSAPRLRRR